MIYREGLFEQELVYEQFNNVPPETPPSQPVGDPGGAITGLSSNTLTVGGKTGSVQNIEAPQPIGTGANPTFGSLTLTGALAAAGLVTAGNLKVGGAETIKLIDYATIAANPGSIPAQTRSFIDVTITGLAIGDMVLVMPPDNLNAGLVFGGARVIAANTLRIYLANITGAAIDDGATGYDYLWFDLT